MLKNKKLLSLVLVFVCTVSMATPVFAGKVSVKELVAQTNQQVEQLIAQAKVQANQCTVNYQNRVAAENAFLAKNPSQKTVVNQRLQSYKNDYDNQINDIGNNLVSNAYNKVMDLYNATSRLEVQLSPEYIPVKLGDKIFYVDPLRLVG